MPILWISAASGALLVFLYLLLRAERIQRRRLLLPELRFKLDVILEEKLTKIQTSKQRLGYFNLRLIGHFILHQLLGVILYFIRTTESIVDKLRVRNKVAAHSAKKVIKSNVEKNHLDHITEHKETIALSDEEKKRIKNEAIGL